MARKEGGKEGRREEGGGWNSELSMNIKRTCYKGAASWAQTTKSTALCLSTTFRFQKRPKDARSLTP